MNNFILMANIQLTGCFTFFWFHIHRFMEQIVWMRSSWTPLSQTAHPLYPSYSHSLTHTQEVAFLAFLHVPPENRSRLRDPVMYHDITVEKGRLLKTRMWDEGCGKHKEHGNDLKDGICSWNLLFKMRILSPLQNVFLIIPVQCSRLLPLVALMLLMKDF